ncbi:head GIN domain-containing protein [Maricaulis parjimensis]|uniref:head GIN domain-containing protein n=1 Tax=Maricaulis parjimensis TaxID=144023 RepID=UPI00193A1323|nr:head GIN domain-containing protein [Maricaulis parjimensis]
MKQVIQAGFGAAVLLGGTALAQDNQTIPVESFDRIDAGGGIEVEIVVGDTESVRLVGDADDFEDVEVRVRNGRLEIEQDSGFFTRRRSLDVVVQVTAREIRELDFNRGVSARVSGIEAGDLEIDVSTGSSARVSGTCGTLELDASTGAALNASDLVCEHVEVSASTGADARTHATQSLRARASMGGSVRVAGRPSDYETRTSMGGSIRLTGEG